MVVRPSGDEGREGERLNADTAAELEELYKSHAPRAFAYLRSRGLGRQSADDLVAEVFLKLGRHIHGGGIIDSPKSYVLRAAQNALIDSLRNSVRWFATDLADRPEMADWASADEIDRICDHLDRRDALRHLSQALAALPPRQRAVITMRYFAHLDDAEIAARLGISEGTVRYHLSKARDKLKELLGEWNEEGSGI